MGRSVLSVRFLPTKSVWRKGLFNLSPYPIVVSLARGRPVKTRTNKYLLFWKKKKKVIRLLLFNARARGYNFEEKKLAYVTVSAVFFN